MAYEPNTWNTGDTITAEKLNRLEQGVAANDTVAGSAVSAASAAQQAAQEAKSAAEAAKQTAEAAQEAIPQAATTSVAGEVKQIAHIEDLSATPTQEDFNGLLAALKTAGIMAAE